MDLTTKWIILSHAAKLVDISWDENKLKNYMIQKSMVTADQFWYQKNVYNILRRRLQYEITDYSWDIFEISNYALDHIKELYNKDIMQSKQLSLFPENKTE